jgi:Flp pilus assembly protein TadD
MLRWIKSALTGRSAEAQGATHAQGDERIDGWMGQATACHRAGDLSGAETFYQHIIDEQPDHAGALYLLGELEALRHNNEKAEGLIRRAISIDDRKAPFHYALGCVLQASGEPSDAAECYRRALALDQAYAAARINLGCILQSQSELELATPGGARAIVERTLEEALSHFRAATEIAPGIADAWINLGYALERQRKLGDARSAYDRALAIGPDLVEARFNRSMVLLAQGDYLAGWEDYEWRWRASGYPRPRYPQAEWDGSQVRGDTVLLYSEQGFGDAIQFVRYAALVAARGARVIVRCPPQLHRLLQGVPGVSATLTPEETPEFDFHCSLLSLPRALRTTIDTIPARVPYIRPAAALVAEWRARVCDRRPGVKVGLVWSSQSMMPNASLKSATLQDLAPLRELTDIRSYSLQMGAAGDQTGPAGTTPLIDHTDKIRDFADTAALIENLDLVITVDTAVAHLAGAMGKPVWTMLQYAPDWRWYPDARTSKWYPSMRLYRQGRRGDWTAIVAEVARDLGELARRTASTSPT